MAEPVVINIAPSSQPQALTIHLEQRPPSWTDVAIYAPTIPGLVVALFGLWIAHRFAAMRDRRKEILELKEATKDALSLAEEACVKVWLEPPSAALILDAKSKLQILGTSATDLKRRTKQAWWRHVTHLFNNCLIAVDVIIDVAKLRNVVTEDPFDDLNHASDQGRATEITAACSELRARIDQQFHSLYG